MSMSDALKFYKGNERDLPELIEQEKIEIGAIYHCEDTGNTYRGVAANRLAIFSAANGRRFMDTEGNIGGEIYGNYDYNLAPHQFSEAHGDHTFTTDANQAVFGKYNDEYYSKRKLFVLGDGSSEKSHNVMSIDELGRIWINDDRMTVTPLIFFGDLDCGDITERGTSLDYSWYEAFEMWSMGTCYPQCYMFLDDLSSSYCQPLKLILTEWNESDSDYSERWFKFRGITEDEQLCTVTLQWSQELGFHYPVEYIPLSGTSELTLYYDWNNYSNWYNESSILTPGNVIVEFIPIDGGDFTNYQNITGFEINGKVYEVTQNKISVQEDFLLYKHLYYFNGEAFELLETIPSINNGINVSVGHTADARFLYAEAAKNMSITPLLVGLMTEYKSTPEVKAFVNKEKPITANLIDGSIIAPGGIHAEGMNPNDERGQTMVYDSQGIIHLNQNGYNDYEMWFNSNHIKLRDASSEVKMLQIGTTTDNREMFYNGNIVSGNNMMAYDSYHATQRRIPHTYYGTTPPDNALGVDGDVYIMYSDG